MVVIGQSAYAQSQTLERFLDAVERGDTAETAFYLDRGLDANATGPNGQSVLMAAARLGRVDIVRLLLTRKAKLDQQSPQGDTALMMAALGGHLDIVRMLAEHGAAIRKAGWNALHYAAFGGFPDVVHYLLEHGADKDAPAPNADTPLMLAVRYRKLEAAQALLARHPDLGHRGQDGKTALGIAKAKDEPELVDLLSRAGAKD